MTLDDHDHLDGLDGPESFAEAAESFIYWCPTPLTVGAVAETLSRLARAGLIVAVELHEETCDAYARQLAHVEEAANDLVARLEARS